MRRISMVMVSAVLIAAILCFVPLLLDNIGSDQSVLFLKDTEKKQEVTENNFIPQTSINNLQYSDASYSALINNIQSYLDDKEGTYGISFLDLTSGAGFGINDEMDFIAASTIKVPINLYLHSLIAQKKVNPNKKLTYIEDYYEEGTGIILDDKFGTKYSIRDLSKLSIENSDNIAINMLIGYLGRDNISEFMESIVKHPVERDRNISTPKDMTIYLVSILDFAKRYPKQGAELIEYLENTEFNDRIPVYLPENIAVAHKIGTQVKAIHDVAVVFAEKPYILSVMSEEVDEDQAPDIIGHISRMVYDFSQN